MAEKVKTFKGLEDLKPYHLIDFIGNGWTAAFLKAEDGYRIKKVPTLEQLPEMLAEGRGDLMINGLSKSPYRPIALAHQRTAGPGHFIENADRTVVRSPGGAIARKKFLVPFP